MTDRGTKAFAERTEWSERRPPTTPAGDARRPIRLSAMTKTARLRRTALLALPLSLALACASTNENMEQPEQNQAEPQLSLEQRSAEVPRTPQANRVRPWTGRFQNESVLLADEIHIEGPKGLLEHVVSVQDPARVEYVVKTTPSGLRQTTRLREDGQPAQIDAQIDAWRLVAFRRLVVLEKPGDVPVRLRGVGRAIHRDGDTGARTEQNVLEYVGD